MCGSGSPPISNFRPCETVTSLESGKDALVFDEEDRFAFELHFCAGELGKDDFVSGSSTFCIWTNCNHFAEHHSSAFVLGGARKHQSSRGHTRAFFRLHEQARAERRHGRKLRRCGGGGGTHLTTTRKVRRRSLSERGAGAHGVLRSLPCPFQDSVAFQTHVRARREAHEAGDVDEDAPDDAAEGSLLRAPGHEISIGSEVSFAISGASNRDLSSGWSCRASFSG